MSISVINTRIDEDLGKRYALYQVDFVSKDGERKLNVWKRWSQCVRFDKETPSELRGVPAFPNTDLFVQLLAPVSKANLSPDFLVMRSEQLQKYLNDYLAVAPERVVEFLTKEEECDEVPLTPATPEAMKSGRSNLRAAPKSPLTPRALEFEVDGTDEDSNSPSRRRRARLGLALGLLFFAACAFLLSTALDTATSTTTSTTTTTVSASTAHLANLASRASPSSLFKPTTVASTEMTATTAAETTTEVAATIPKDDMALEARRLRRARQTQFVTVIAAAAAVTSYQMLLPPFAGQGIGKALSKVARPAAAAVIAVGGRFSTACIKLGRVATVAAEPVVTSSGVWSNAVVPAAKQLGQVVRQIAMVPWWIR